MKSKLQLYNFGLELKLERIAKKKKMSNNKMQSILQSTVTMRSECMYYGMNTQI